MGPNGPKTDSHSQLTQHNQMESKRSGLAGPWGPDVYETLSQSQVEQFMMPPYKWLIPSKNDWIQPCNDWFHPIINWFHTYNDWSHHKSKT